MPWFHYELGGVNHYGIDVSYEAQRLFGWLKPGGTFVLQICTDFSGTFPKSNVLNNMLDAYLGLLAPQGEVFGYCQRRGKAIRNDRESASRILIVVQKADR